MLILRKDLLSALPYTIILILSYKIANPLILQINFTVNLTFLLLSQSISF